MTRPNRRPSLPERLYAARERKGVDLYRAERDTKIRARYLGALERGDYKELPGAVYTKGFLRNYALYLGLDPDDVLDQWRRERGDARDAAPVIAVPRPIAAPRQGLTFSPSIVVVALLTVCRARLRRVPRHPGAALRQAADDRGDRPGRGGHRRRRVDHELHAARDDAAGRHGLDRDPGPRPVPGHRRPGRRLDGRRRPPPRPEPVRHQRGRPGHRQAVRGDDPPASSRCRSSQIEAPTLTVDQPAEGTSFENGAIPVAGRATNAASVVVSAAYVGPSTSTPVGGEASATRRAAGRARIRSRSTVGDDGSFSTPYELTAGSLVDHGHRGEPAGQDRRR